DLRADCCARHAELFRSSAEVQRFGESDEDGDAGERIERFHLVDYPDGAVRSSRLSLWPAGRKCGPIPRGAIRETKERASCPSSNTLPSAPPARAAASPPSAACICASR